MGDDIQSITVFKCPTKIGDYGLIDVIGDGAFSVVYKVTHIPTNSVLAMKVIMKDIVKEASDKERLQREIDTMASLQHENIVQLHDFFSDDNYYYLVMDYCPSGDLFDYLQTMPRMKESQAATVFQQIVSAIAFCHSHGIAHRDLKPQNILITAFPYIKLCDFGLCQYFDNSSCQNSTKMKTCCGSPFYAAPECLAGKTYDGQMSDTWSLGVILYEIVTKQHPWPVENTPLMIQRIKAVKYAIPEDISPSCIDLIHSMLKLKPSDRIKPADILNHPWMKLASSQRYKRACSLPKLAPDAFLATIQPNLTPLSSSNIGQGQPDSIISPFAAVRSSNAAKIQRINSRGRTNQFEKVMTMGSKSPRSSVECSKPVPRPRPRMKLAPLPS